MIQPRKSKDGISETGIVYLVGAGPGDPGLITVKGLEKIRTADVIVYDYLAGNALVREAGPEAELIYVGKKGKDHTLEQQDINQLLVRKAEEGKKIVRLKGGDPYVFGRGGEEAEQLAAAGIPFEVVPGVTSAVAAPAVRRYSRDTQGSCFHGDIYHRARRPQQRSVCHRLGSVG